MIFLSVLEDDGCIFTPRQSSLNSQIDCKLMKQQQNSNKKKSSLLKGLGSMFRYLRLPLTAYLMISYELRLYLNLDVDPLGGNYQKSS